MGYIAHHAIVVTGDEEEVKAAHAKATALGCLVTNIAGPGVNAYYSFMIAPDGSKEGWTDSDEGDTRRAAWIASGIGNLCEWAEIRFGADDAVATVSRSAWDDDETHPK